MVDLRTGLSLKKQGAAFANTILTPESANWQNHWRITAVLVYRFATSAPAM